LGLLCLAASSGLPACSLAEPNTDELVRPTLGAGGAGGTGVNVGSAGTAAVVYPVLPTAGTANALPDAGMDAGEAPSSLPDAGPVEPPPCVDCETVRIATGVETVQFGSPGGSLYMDICPRDQVVVGMDYRFDFGTPADFGYITSVAPVCGELVPNRSAGTLDVVIGEPLPPRGAGSGVSGVGGRCPPGQVVTAFEGARNSASNTSVLRELTLHCAALSLSDGTSAVIGTARPAPPLSADFAVSTVLPEEVLPVQSCPAGQVVRGVALRAGAWVDAVRFVCGVPVLAKQEGQACSSAIECQSGSCNGTCQPRACTPAAGCSCGLLQSTQYAFCRAAQTRAAAALLCTASGMHLAYAEDPIVHGWLRTTAAEEGIQAELWLGADDLASEGSWQWVDGGGAVDLASELWDENAQSGGTAENCLALTRDGHWDDVSCTLALPFACEAPPP
jgi:hypothetical protein